MPFEHKTFYLYKSGILYKKLESRYSCPNRKTNPIKTNTIPAKKADHLVTISINRAFWVKSKNKEIKSNGNNSPKEKTPNIIIPYTTVDESAAKIKRPPNTGDMQALQPEAKITPSKKAPVLELTFSHFGIKKPPDFMPIIENILDGEIIVIPKKK